MRRALLAALLVAVTIAGPAGTAIADGTADEADLHFRMGAEDFSRRNYDGALSHFLLSNRLAPNKNVVFNIASTYDAMRRYPDAYRYYVDALDGETNQKVIADLKAAIAKVEASVAVLEVKTTPPGATLYVDRKDLGSRGKTPRVLALPAGKYKLIIELEGYETKVIEGIDAHLGARLEISGALKQIVGKVRVELEGNKHVEVRVDDEHAPPSCTTPCDLEIAPGRHELHFTTAGFQGAPRIVNVVANQTTKLVVPLVGLTGTLLVRTDERDAAVMVDGRTMGFTPAVITGVDAGRRKVRIVLRGFAPYEAEVDVKPNQQSELIDIPLKPQREVTTVSRYAESLDDAPSSVSVIDGQELRAFGYPTIAEALRGIRGVYLSNDRAYYSAGFRGLGQPNDYGNRVLILSDGASLNDNLLESSYIGADGRLDLHDVDRIEVVRGPGSLLYGTGAFGGVVNLVTRPREEPSSVHVGISTYDDAVIRARAGFHYNFSPKAGIWASVSSARSDGVDVNIPLKDHPAHENATALVHRADAFWGVGTAGRAWYGPLTLQWFYNNRDQTIPTGAYGTAVGDSRSHFNDTRYMAEIRFEPRVNKYVEILTRAHANRYEFHSGYSFETGELNNEDFYGTWFGAEARAAITPIEQIRITAGGEFQYHPQATLLGVTHADGDTTQYLDEKLPYRFGAAYALVDATPFKWLKLSGGARLDVYSTFGLIVVPRAAIIFKPATGSTLKLMGGRAFRAPSIYEQLYNDGGLSQVRGTDPSRGLKPGPESIYQGEIEYSQRFKEDWVALGAVYVSYIQGLMETVLDTPTSDKIRYANSPVPVLGIGGDVELRREWRRGWMLSASYGYQRIRYLDSKVDDARLVNSPEHLASFRAVAPVVRDLVSLGTRLSFEAPRRISLETHDVTDTWVVADAAVSGNIRDYGIRYTVGVYNIGDKRYKYPVTDTFASRTMPQNGRTFLVDVMGTYP